MDNMFGKISGLFNNFWYRKTYGGFFPFVDETEALIIEKMYNLYMIRDTYENLPDELQELYGPRNFIDGQLFFQPSMAWFKDKKHGLLCLPTSGEYEFNVVGRPVKWSCWGYNGEHWELDDSNSVIMFNDEAMTIPFLHIKYEAGFMREADKTAMQNIFAQRQPWIVETDEDTLKSAQAEMQQLGEFKPVIFRRKLNGKNGKMVDPIETKVFNTNTPIITKEMDDLFTLRLNRILTYLGLNNIGVQDKKERLVVAETSGNDMLIQSYYTSAMNQRKKAVEKVNKMFGTNIKCVPTELTTMQTAINSTVSELMAGAQAKGFQPQSETGKRGDE